MSHIVVFYEYSVNYGNDNAFVRMSKKKPALAIDHCIIYFTGQQEYIDGNDFNAIHIGYMN